MSSGGRASFSMSFPKLATEAEYGSIPRDTGKNRERRQRSELHVVIAGCGRVGSELATNLERLGHSVAVIDKNPKAFERLKQDFSGKTIVGFAFDREILEEAGIKDASAFASVTSGDNSNILSARVTKEHYRVPEVVARIYDPRRAQIYQRLGIQTVATVRWTTDQILRTLFPDEVPVEYTVDNGEVVVTALPVPAELVGHRAVQVDLAGRRRVVAVSRFGIPRVPDKDLTLQEGDILHVSVVRTDLSELLDEVKKAGQPE
jgi:trk system potassium uptake protein